MNILHLYKSDPQRKFKIMEHVVYLHLNLDMYLEDYSCYSTSIKEANLDYIGEFSDEYRLNISYINKEAYLFYDKLP